MFQANENIGCIHKWKFNFQQYLILDLNKFSTPQCSTACYQETIIYKLFAVAITAKEDSQQSPQLHISQSSCHLHHPQESDASSKSAHALYTVKNKCNQAVWQRRCIQNLKISSNLVSLTWTKWTQHILPKYPQLAIKSREDDQWVEHTVSNRPFNHYRLMSKDCRTNSNSTVVVLVNCWYMCLLHSA